MQTRCGFCDGTGLWLDPDLDPTAIDPCPLCEGSGVGDSPPHPPAHRVGVPCEESARPFERLSVALEGFTPAERQRLYEELYTRYGCRIYRG